MTKIKRRMTCTGNGIPQLKRKCATMRWRYIRPMRISNHSCFPCTCAHSPMLAANVICISENKNITPKHNRPYRASVISLHSRNTIHFIVHKCATIYLTIFLLVSLFTASRMTATHAESNTGEADIAKAANIAAYCNLHLTEPPVFVCVNARRAQSWIIIISIWMLKKKMFHFCLVFVILYEKIKQKLLLYRLFLLLILVVVVTIYIVSSLSVCSINRECVREPG